MAIIYDASKLKAFEMLEQLCTYTGKSAHWQEELWNGLLDNQNIYGEFLYYLEHHNLLGEYRIAGYSVIDLFIWQLDCYNLSCDTGKIDARCNKETMILNSFYHMIKMHENPEEYLHKLEKGFGNDRL